MSTESYEAVHPPTIDRIVVLENPVSKNGALGRQQLDIIRNLVQLGYRHISSDPDPDVTHGKLDILEPTDVLFVIGGDGTVNPSVRALERSQAVLLPTRSGNANDLSRAAYGRQPTWQVFRDFISGETVASAVRPIQVEIGAGSQSVSELAVNYASVGYAALASEYVNRPWKNQELKRMIERLPRRARNGIRLPRDGYQLLDAAHDAKPFGYVEYGSIDVRHAVDISVTHSSNMAKFGQFKVAHTEPHLFHSVLTRPGRLQMLRQYALMTQAAMAGDYRRSVGFELTGEQDDQLFYQVDGEASPLPEGSDVYIGLSSRTIRIAGPKLSERGASLWSKMKSSFRNPDPN
jgi:hypothetical protein